MKRAVCVVLSLALFAALLLQPALAEGNAVLTGPAAGESAISLQVVDPVSRVSFPEKAIELSCNTKANHSYTLKPVFEPAEGAYDELVYSSGNESIASVDQNGRVVALAPGNTKITLTVKTNGAGKTVKAAVNVNCVTRVTSVTGTGTVEVGVNKTKKITPSVSPENATNKKLSWKSSNEAIATVDANGSVKARKAGTCYVTCSTTDGSGINKKFTVKVIQPVKAVKTVLKNNGIYEFPVTQKLTLNSLFTVEPGDATNRALSWKVIRQDEVSFNEKLNYSVRKDVLTIYNPGVYKITATSKDGTNKSASYTVRVYPEDKMALSLPYVYWRDSGYDNLQLTFDIFNEKYGASVAAVELFVYAKDVWGNDIYGTSVYYGTTNKTIGPGKTVRSDHIVIPKRSRISEIYCGIHQIKFSDGSFTMIRDVKYTNFTYR